MLREENLRKFMVISAIGLLVILSIITLWPIAISIIIGLILAYIFYPVYNLVLKVVREKNISALIIVLLIIFIIFLPLWFLFPVVTRQIFEAYTYSQKIDIYTTLKSFIPETLSRDTIVMVNNFISKIVSAVFTQMTNTLLDITNLLLQAAVVLFVFFFAMRDAEKLKSYVKEISPFSEELEESLSKQFKEITRSVIYGHIVVGVLQGVLTGIGLWLFGVPNVLILTILAILAAIIPVIGAWLVWLPASLYLLFSGHTGAGIGLFLYGAILVSWIDNILRPYIVARKSNISTVVAVVGMLGGLIVFGIIGLIIGPLILAYLLVLLDAYKDKKLSRFFQ